MVFDIETTQLIDEERVEIDAMEVSVACAMRLQEGGQGCTVQRQISEAEHYTFWHPDAGAHTGDGGVQELLGQFDRASLLVAYNGMEFDMRVLRRYYGEGEAAEARYKAHLRKLHDPMVAVHKASGRRARLSHLLQLNGQKGKAGSGCDAPGLWRAGRVTQLATYCMRDVEVLAALVLRRSIRVPGGGEIEEASVWPALKGAERRREDAEAQAEAQEQEKGETRAARGGDNGGGQGGGSGETGGHASGKRRAREGDEADAQRQTRQSTIGYSAADAAEEIDVADNTASQSQEVEIEEEAVTSETDEEEETVPPPAGTPISRRRSKRKRHAEGFYDGARRRKKRKTRGGYMEKTRGVKRKIALREGIEVGSTTIERIVQGRYEWRDMQYKKTSQNRVWDPGIT